MNLIRHFSSEKLFFTSDTHFCHNNIISFCSRPFSSVEQMNETLIKNWNETVPEEGTVFFLGDFCMKGSTFWKSILERLNGKIYFIIGNHDIGRIKESFADRFEAMAEQMTIVVDGQEIILNHNPMLCYGGSYRNTWQLFGHVHSGPYNNSGLDMVRLSSLFPLQYDVGVDNNDFRPVSYAQVKEKIANQVTDARNGLYVNNGMELPDKVIFADVSELIGEDGSGYDALESLCKRSNAPIVVTGKWSRFGLGAMLRKWEKEALPGTLCGVTQQWGDIEERISYWIGTTGISCRYIYIGPESYNDFRFKRVKGILTDENVEEALKLL